MQKSSKKQKISRFDLRILDIMGVSDSCQTTCLLFTVKKTLSSGMPLQFKKQTKSINISISYKLQYLKEYYLIAIQ